MGEEAERGLLDSSSRMQALPRKKRTSVSESKELSYDQKRKISSLLQLFFSWMKKSATRKLQAAFPRPSTRRGVKPTLYLLKGSTTRLRVGLPQLFPWTPLPL